MKSTLVLLVLAILATPAFGDDPARQLRGQLCGIEQGMGNPRPLANVRVTIREFGTGDLTNDQGLFRIPLPASALPGQEVTLSHDKKGYAIYHPLLGKVRIPARPDEVVEIRMLPEGSKAFWTPERIEEFIARTASESAKKPPSRPGEATDLSAYILELGRHYGFTADEVRREIGKWMEVARKDVTDFRRQGMVAFAEKRFGMAGETFRRGAELEAHKSAEHLREAAALQRLSGDVFCSTSDYRAALEEYRIAHESLSRFHDILRILKCKAYPGYATDIRELSFKMANTKSELGKRIAGPESMRYLNEAVLEYRDLIAQIPKSTDPEAWASTQDELGLALTALGQRLGGPEGQRRLNEAVEAYRLALTVRTRNDLPQDWARTQNDLGHALRALGERQGGPEGPRRLSEAVAAYRLALTVRKRDDLPQGWATTQNNLGSALQDLGRRLGGPEGVRRLNEAVEAYRQDLTIYTRADLPQDWARTQNNLGPRSGTWAGVRGVRRVCGG